MLGRTATQLHIVELPWLDPADAFIRLSDRAGLAFLDSAAQDDARAEASYLCVDPVASAVWREGQAGDPFQLLRALTECRQADYAPLPFCGGVVGLLGYELGRTLERLPSSHPHPGAPADLVAHLYDTVIGFDLRARRCWVMAWDRPGELAAKRCAALTRQLAISRRSPPTPPLEWRELLPQPAYRSRVTRVLDYIRAGDIYQANFTAPLVARRPPDFDPISAYRSLRSRSPAPFAAYLDLGGRDALLCASPERFLRLSRDGRIETRPIKGTISRATAAEEDQAAATRLFESAKDRAENLMIVDLLRNDLGRVAETGSITVPELFRVESFASVHHLVSVVRARLRPGLDAVDLLRACFPGGSVTGAPKIRAMQIIDELEVARRGAYCGSVVRIGFDGAMDSNIVIRSIVATEDLLIAQAGGGIVADSDPAAEYREMRLKLASVL